MSSVKTMKAGVVNELSDRGQVRLATLERWDAACEVRKDMFVEERRLLDIMCDWAACDEDARKVALGDLTVTQAHRAILTEAISTYEVVFLGAPAPPAVP